jgi:hypothetical protein
MSWSGAANVVPKVITPFAPKVTVSTETPLETLLDLGGTYERLAFTLRNYDALLNAALYVDTSESGVVVAAQRNILIIPPLSEATIDFLVVMRRYFSVSASGDPEAGFTAVDVAYEIIGLDRHTNANRRTLRAL